MLAILIEWIVHLCHKVQLVERYIYGVCNTTMAIVNAGANRTIEAILENVSFITVIRISW